MYCDKCGKAINDDAKFCRYCGNKLSELDNNQKQVKENFFREKSADSQISEINLVELETNEQVAQNKESFGSKCLHTFGKFLYWAMFIIAISIGKVFGKSFATNPADRIYLAQLGGGILGGILAGVICALLPLILSKIRVSDVKYSWWFSRGFFILCVAAGFIGGLTFAVPVSFIESIVIWNLSKKQE